MVVEAARPLALAAAAGCCHLSLPFTCISPTILHLFLINILQVLQWKTVFSFVPVYWEAHQLVLIVDFFASKSVYRHSTVLHLAEYLIVTFPWLL